MNVPSGFGGISVSARYDRDMSFVTTCRQHVADITNSVNPKIQEPLHRRAVQCGLGLPPPTMGQDAPTSNNQPQPPLEIKATHTTVGLKSPKWRVWLQQDTTRTTGKNVVAHNRPGGRASWALHGEPGWYIEPAMEHYRCHKKYFPKTTSERISDAVELFPKKFSMPNM